MDQGIPNVSTRPITQSNTKNIQRAFILHPQNWIGSIQPPFHVIKVDLIEELPFGASKVNICTGSSFYK